MRQLWRPLGLTALTTVLTTVLTTALTTAVLVTPLAAQTVPALPAVGISAADIQAFLAALPRDAVSNRPIRIVDVGTHRVGVYGVFRPRSIPGDAVLHETAVSEVYYMLSGTATLVTGGTLVDVRRPAAADTAIVTVRGSRIEGGESRRMAAGDMVILPPGVAHWWSSLDGDITYLIVRPDPGNRLPLR